jgi:hypothetical protein
LAANNVARWGVGMRSGSKGASEPAGLQAQVQLRQRWQLGSASRQTSQVNSLTTVMRPELPKPTRAFLMVRILKMTCRRGEGGRGGG